MLVDKSHGETNDGRSITFSALFDMKVEAGFKHDVEQEARCIFRLKKPDDAPIYFDASRMDPGVQGLEGDGSRLPGGDSAA